MDRAFRKLLKAIAPDGMAPEEYVVLCAINGVSASPDDLRFVRWLIGEQSHAPDGGRYEKAGGAICEMIENGSLLDFKNLSGENDRFMASAVVDAVLWRNASFKKNFYEAVLRAAPRRSCAWKTAYRLNRAIGFTSVCYFIGEDGNPADGI